MAFEKRGKPADGDHHAREYPYSPVVGVGVLVVRDGCYLLVKRAQEPSLGRWTVPGGRIELGECAREAARREVAEECGIDVEIRDVLDVYDYVERDKAKKIKYHYVVIDFLGEYLSGELAPGSDIAEAVWLRPDELSEYDVPKSTLALLGRVRRAESWSGRSGESSESGTEA